MNSFENVSSDGHQMSLVGGGVGGLLAGTDRGFPVGGGANPPGAPAYDFAKISEKLHEIEQILGRWGAPPWIHHCLVSCPRDWGQGYLYSEVQCIMGHVHMRTPLDR